MKKQQLKTLPMPRAQALSEQPLADALARLAGEPHDGWADLVVHPSRLRAAMDLARAHAAGEIRVRVLSETQFGLNGWELRSRTAKIVNLV